MIAERGVEPCVGVQPSPAAPAAIATRRDAAHGLGREPGSTAVVASDGLPLSADDGLLDPTLPPSADAGEPVATVRRTSAAYAATKRVIDLLGASFGLILTGPLLGLLALLVRLQDGGPAFVAQERVGRSGRRFRCYKLRTMTVDAPARRAELAAQRFGSSPQRFKLEHDPRVTPLGRVLRRWSLDELPQLANVARGDMSLVGPRPLLPDEVAQHDARALGRLAVRPGLTCFWQVSGRSLLPFERQLDLDLEYVARRGLLVDLLLLARTVPAVLSGRGAF